MELELYLMADTNPAVLKEFVALAEAMTKLRGENKARDFKPYPTQRNFLDDKHKIKVMLGGNQTGKSLVGSYEIYLHLTGDYPADWRGIRFTHPVEIWIAGESAPRVRDTIQTKLFGALGQPGTGMIPKAAIPDDRIIKKSGVPHAIDIAYVKHKSGMFSSVQFFSYDQGREKFQGSTIDMIWFDEEPPEDVYNECKMRVMVKQGYIMFTFTPLSGITKLYDSLVTSDKVGVHHLTTDEAEHLTEEAKEEMFAGMDEDEINARKYGRATSGSRLIFPFGEDQYVCDDFEPSPAWRCIGGLDVGLDHPTAAVKMYVDDVADCVYFTREYSVSQKTAADHANVLKKWECEFAIDPSAVNGGTGGQASTADLYRSEGLKIFKANNVVWDRKGEMGSLHAIRLAIAEGRFWIFRSCAKTIKQMRLYRTKESTDGGTSKIYKLDDDCVDAVRYAFMAKDKATIPGHARREEPIPEVEEWKPSDPRTGY
jgi:phage terminase large subunit-like protein